jgi:2-polyprenyl-3-methyl-5-hydroxy-6-metoxy-1,4-benzoquinol methylase
MDTRTQRYFHDHASQFDSIYHEGQPLQRAFNRTFRKAIYERFAITFEQAGPLVGKTVLDIGCGSGRYAVEFARRGAARVTGIDYAPNMLSLARQYAHGQGVADRCEFIEGDFTTHLVKRTFHLVIAIGVFDYQDRPVEFLRKMAQHSEGKIIASFPGRSLVRMPLRKFRYWLGNCPVLFYREQEVHTIGRDAGLRTVDIVPIHSSGTGFMLIGTV